MSVIDAAVLERHGLKPDEYDRIVALLGREPNLTELGLFSVMWSEHCSYKSSRVHLRTLPTTGPRVLQGPGENAGAVDIGDGLAAVFKIESHNHPSFIEPYQGAATGVGGIIRDIFTMGARPIALLDALRFGPPSEPRSRRILQGVVRGIGGYGNSIGIPTVGGEVMFDETYSGNPLVNVFCLGIAKHEALVKGRASGVGNPVYYVGAKTGPRRHPWRDDGVRGIRRQAGREAARRAGRRSVHGEASARGLSGGADHRRVRGHAGHGRSGLVLRHLRDGLPRRSGRRDRRHERSATRDRNDAVRNHAVGIAGADAADRETRSRGRCRARLRKVGSARGPDRRSHRRAGASREGERRGRGRSAEPRAGRRSPGLQAAVS